VEVKTRSSEEFGPPQTGVTARKQRQLTKIALYYLQKHQLFHRDARFDVVAVEKGSGTKQVTMIRNAFEVSDRSLSKA
jgi:putative endonuclease